MLFCAKGELRVPFNSRLSEEREFALTPARAVRTRMLACQHMRVPFARYVHPRYRLSLAALPLRLEQPTGLALELDILLPDDHDDFHALQVRTNTAKAFALTLPHSKLAHLTICSFAHYVTTRES